MAQPTLQQAREWFEEGFREVHLWSRATHPATLSAAVCPNGEPYIAIANGHFKPQGEPPIGPPLTEQDAVQAWSAAVDKYAELFSDNKGELYLWWRNEPRFLSENRNDGKGCVYSRLAITRGGPYISYTGRPLRAQRRGRISCSPI